MILCERGIRTFERATRNTLDLSVIPLIREMSHLPIIVDPSHATGKRKLVPIMGKAALVAGAHGHHGGGASRTGQGALRRRTESQRRGLCAVDGGDPRSEISGYLGYSGRGRRSSWRQCWRPSPSMQAKEGDLRPAEKRTGKTLVPMPRVT